jgi:hypothetical protein
MLWGAQFADGEVSFVGARFHGGEVSFRTAQEWAAPPRGIDWRRPPSGVVPHADAAGEA